MATVHNMHGFQLKRIYDPASEADGNRILVDRLWPRGVKKETAQLDGWDKDIAPSAALRRWFDHKPERFDEFSARYCEELASKGEELERLRQLAKKTRITLLYAARDNAINHARVLKELLETP